MEVKAGEIAHVLRGTLHGDPEVKVSGIAKIEEGSPTDISFIADAKYLSYLNDTKAGVLIISSDLLNGKTNHPCIIEVPNARQSLAQILSHFHKPIQKQGISPSSHIHQSAEVDSSAYVGDMVYIGQGSRVESGAQLHPTAYIGENVHIGENTVVYPGAKILRGSKIGKHCIIQSGAVIGAEGFGFYTDQSNQYNRVYHAGNVVLEDHVEIGANTTIDRGSVGDTVLKKGVKLDNLIQVAHNVEIGEDTAIAAQAGVAGSAKIGSQCKIGGQVGVVGHLSVGDNVMIAAQSGIGKDVPSGSIVQGSPAFDVKTYKKSYVLFRKLPELYQDIVELKREKSSSSK